LLGGWGGWRQALEEAGLTFESLIIMEIVAHTSGGKRRGSTVLGNVDLTMTLDTEKAGWWSGGTFFVHLLGDVGGNPTSFVGATQVTSNIEAPDTFKVFAAWYEYRFFEDKLALLFGLHPYDSEFYVLEFAGYFLNSSFGTSPEVAQTGPFIFPTTALAVRAKYQLLPHVYVLAAVYDGVPGHPTNPYGTHIILRCQDGLFYGLEVGLTPPADQEPARHYKLAVGACGGLPASSSPTPTACTGASLS
jgi:porin